MYLFVLTDIGESYQMVELGHADIESAKDGHASVYKFDGINYYEMNEFGKWKKVETYK